MIQLTRLARRATRLSAAAPLICAAICLALYACAQPPQPQPTAAPAPPSIASPAPTAVTPPVVQPTPSPAPTAAPTATPTAQPTPVPSSSYADPIPIPENVAFTQISAGKTHACGLRENGSIVCWGYDEHNNRILDAPAGTDFRQISAGHNFTCALRQDATIACWGNNSHGQATPPQGAFSEIAVGTRQACAVPRSQSSPPKLICWGEQFPNGAETLPLDVPFSNIQSGAGFICGLTPKADMACLRIYQNIAEITPGPFTRLGVGLHHVCALRPDGSAFCQGENDSMQASPPTTKFAQISAGWHHACGITRARQIECWGSGRAGSPGERLAAPNGEFTAISIGWRNSCALRPNGRATCWYTRDYYSYRLPLGIDEAFGGAKFDTPVDIFPWPNGGLAIVDRRGVITAHHDEPNPPPPQTILDISNSVVCCPGETGMFSASLDPRFHEFPFLYVWYGAIADNALGEGTPGVSGRLARFRVKNGVALKSSELIILEVAQPGKTRLGGSVRFGADGMLYLGIGVGDGRATADAQSLNTLRGKIIRIDIRGADAAQPYRIPPDNPFAHTPDALPEIWAYGLRNPWRMAFDPENPNLLFIGDVGENTKEEVSIATAGANLGWPLCEADLCQESLDPAIAATLTPPAVAYDRNSGCAVIGGVKVPWLDNGFIFGDVCARRVWLLERDASQDDASEWQMREIADLSALSGIIFAFGADADGNVYVLSYKSPIIRLYPGLVR